MKNWYLLALTAIGASVFLVPRTVSSSFPSAKPCICRVAADPHYYTFDGQVIHFMGTCKYILSTNTPGSKLNYFSVEVKNENRYNKYVSYTRMVDLKLKGVVIRLMPANKILVNSINVNLPLKDYLGFSAEYSAGWVTITTRWGLSLKFDGNHQILLKLPGSFRNNLTGICGDCNGLKDDFRTKDGEDVSKNKKKYALIGKSYQVCDDSDKPEKCTIVLHEEKCSPAEVKICDILTSNLFRSCVKKVGKNILDETMNSCKVDACAYRHNADALQSAFCKAIAAFATECSDFGIFVDWRKTAKCEKKCPLNQKYEYKTSSCQPTCVNATYTCNTNTEGCTCKTGYILSGQDCVPQSQCGCKNGNSYMKINEELYSPNCTRKTKCHGNGNVTYTKLDGCQANSDCKVYKEKRMCVCRPGYFLQNNECIKFECDKPVDVQFLVESSAIGKVNFEETKLFVSSFIDFFTINFYSVRMSIHSYYDRYFSIRLSNSDDPEQILHTIKNMKYIDKKDTSLYFALNGLYNNRLRLNLRKPTKSHSAVIVFVGNKLLYEKSAKDRVTKLNKAGFSIYIVGIGEKFDKETLKNIIGESNSDNLMLIDNYYKLNNIKNQILKKTCSVDPCKYKPCKNGGKCINKDSTFICVCRKDYFGRFCAQVKKCSCYTYGGVNYHTFDAQTIRFNGDCVYNLVSGKTFSVDVMRETVNDRTITRAVDVKISSIKILLLPLLKIRVNDQEYNLPVMKFKEFDAYFTAGWIVVTTKWGLIVKYDGQDRVIVSLPLSFANKLTGICGNCNGKEDDFSTRDGLDVSSKTDKEVIIAQSYRVNGPSKKSCKTSAVNEKCDESDVQPCKVIYGSIFKSCVQEIGMNRTDSFFNACSSNVCKYKNNINSHNLLCEHIKDFVTECEKHGVPINWRGLTKCPMFCKYGEIYNYRGTSCRNDCVKRVNCSTHSEGCVCIHNRYYSAKECVTPTWCGCTINKMYTKRYQYSVDSNCKKRQYCHSTNKYKPYTMSCSKNGKCALENGNRKCVCKNGYYHNNCYPIREPYFILVLGAELKTTPWVSYSVTSHECYLSCYYNRLCKSYGYDPDHQVCELFDVDATGNITLTASNCKRKYYYQRSSLTNIILNGASLGNCKDFRSIENIENIEECKKICLQEKCYGFEFSKSKNVCRMMMSYKERLSFSVNEDGFSVGLPIA